MRVRTVWQALGGPGFLLSSWPLRSAGYLFASGLTGFLTLIVGVLILSIGGLLSVFVIGLPFLVGFLLLGLPVATLERRLMRIIDDRPLPDPHRKPPGTGLRVWLQTRFTESMTWRELGYAVLLAVVLWPIDLLAVTLAVAVPAALLATPVLLATVGDGDQVNVLKTWSITSFPPAFAVSGLGLLAAAAGAYGIVLLAGARSALSRTLITPGRAELGVRITELTRSRIRLVDAFEAERGRIERDLHDGAQQRLVALAMMLGIARLDAPDGPLRDQLSRAHHEAGMVLVELRELIRGVHPPVLTDFGLPAAIAEVADRSPVPVDVALNLPERFPRVIESTIYFVVAEALSNLARHSGADHAKISGEHTRGVLVVRVWDNGQGGADISGGTGLLGLGDRVSVVDGKLSLSSPPGGPTQIVVEVPCEPLPHSG